MNIWYRTVHGKYSLARAFDIISFPHVTGGAEKFWVIAYYGDGPDEYDPVKGAFEDQATAQEWLDVNFALEANRKGVMIIG